MAPVTSLAADLRWKNVYSKCPAVDMAPVAWPPPIWQTCVLSESFVVVVVVVVVVFGYSVSTSTCLQPV